MKTKVLMIAVLLGFSTVLIAQPTENGPKKSFRGHEHEMQMEEGHGGFGKGLNLTDAQKDAFKQGMMAMQKEVKPLHNELGEAMAHQKTLVSVDKPDMAAINKNIEKIGALKVEIAKLQMKHRLDMRAQLTDEQRMKFDAFKANMKKGRGHGRMMQEMHEGME
jgi:Spy/CpxP family protein refolding chaperone